MRLPNLSQRAALACSMPIVALASSLVRADGACSDPGHLRQTVLVVLRFPPEGAAGALSPSEENHIRNQLDARHHLPHLLFLHAAIVMRGVEAEPAIEDHDGHNVLEVNIRHKPIVDGLGSVPRKANGYLFDALRP